MSEIETSDKQNENNHSEDLINKENKEDTKIKDNSKLKYLLFALFSILIIIILLVCTYIYYQKSHSSKISEKSKNIRSKEKNEKEQKLEDSKIVKYETPFILTTTLDYLLYPYHSDIIKNMDDYEFIRDCLGKISLKMVFNSNINGDYALDVHTRVNYHHILAIIETENGNRFGGYTSDNFSPQTLGLSSTNIELLKQEGDLLLRDQFMTNGGSSNFPDCYGDDSTQKFELTNGEENFTVKSFEIYHVLFFAEFGDEGNRMGVHKNYVK